MSIEVANAEGSLGQFASNAGYSDLIEAAQNNPTLKKFFDDANTEEVKPVIEALNEIKTPKDVAASAHQLAALMEGQSLVYITNGTHQGDDKVNKAEGDAFVMEGNISKLDKSQHLVFGWASIVTINGEELCDTQGDIIHPDTMENAAYNFVLTARKAGEMHQSGSDGEVRGIGRLVESVCFTREKQMAMLQSLHDQGITDALLDLRCEGWWIGFKIDNLQTWSQVESGELKAFSIGGKGKRDPRP